MLEKVKQIVYRIRGQEEHVAVGHVLPLWLLVAVALALIALTWVTVAITYIDLGRLNLFVALLIAGVKAFLVALYFMHLRYDRPFNGIVFLGAIVFAVLFIAFAMMDSRAYQPEIIRGYQPQIEQVQQQREMDAAAPGAGEGAAGSEAEGAGH